MATGQISKPAFTDQEGPWETSILKEGQYSSDLNVCSYCRAVGLLTPEGRVRGPITYLAACVNGVAITALGAMRCWSGICAVVAGQCGDLHALTKGPRTAVV